MRGLTIMLVLSVLVSSILAMPKAYEDRDEQENAISAARKYLLRQYENGIISKVYTCVHACLMLFYYYCY